MFQQIEKLLGTQDIDLFASRHNAQKRRYVSWKPDPEACTFDAFALNWEGLKGYAFPPFCLIGRCLAKVRRYKAKLVLITPIWQTQQWYPGMSVREPNAEPINPMHRETHTH